MDIGIYGVKRLEKLMKEMNASIKEKLVSTKFGIDFYLLSDNKTVFLEFNPRCRICDNSLKDPEYETLYRDTNKDSPAYGSVLERSYLCPDCKVHTGYKIMDFSLALKELAEPLKQRQIEKINLMKDPFLEPIRSA